MEVVDTVRLEVPVPPEESATLVGFNDADGPLGDIVAARFTVPTNPARLVKLIVEVVEKPGFTARPLGLAEA